MTVLVTILLVVSSLSTSFYQDSLQNSSSPNGSGFYGKPVIETLANATSTVQNKPLSVPLRVANYTRIGQLSQQPSTIHEPAPMGIADWGLGPKDQQYSNQTSSFVGKAKVYALNDQGSEQITLQLNVFLTFYYDGILYSYWVQDIAWYVPPLRIIAFGDQIWNSTLTTFMDNSTLTGNGTIYPTMGTSDYYEGYAPTSLPGNNIPLSYPFTIGLMVNSTVNPRGIPEVTFSFNDGFGWETYDNVYFIFAKESSELEDLNFLADHSHDAAFILGGISKGEPLANSNLYMQLLFWNGNNYQMPFEAYVFDANTGETVSSVSDTEGYYQSNGTLFAHITEGNVTSTNSSLYSQDQIGVVHLTSPDYYSGKLVINSTDYLFTNYGATIVLHPGNYSIRLISGSYSYYVGLYHLQAGETLRLTAPRTSVYDLDYFETGLPGPHLWSVSLSGNGSEGQPINTNLITSAAQIQFLLPNGTYTFNVTTVSDFSSSLSSGIVVMNGSNISKNIFFNRTSVPVYLVSFVAEWLPLGINWDISFNGSAKSTSNGGGGSIDFRATNGSYRFSVGNVPGYVEFIPPWVIKVAGIYQIVETHFSSESWPVSIFPSSKTTNTFQEVTFSNTTSNVTPPYWYSYFITLNGTPGYLYLNQGNSFLFTKAGLYEVYLVVRNSDNQSGFASVSITVNSAANEPKYTIIFSETGLPSGTPWNVSISVMGFMLYNPYSSSDNIELTEPNGTYSFAVGTNFAYSPSPSSGNLTVNGSSINEKITFVRSGYTVTFSESGLPPGGFWITILNGFSESSSINETIFYSMNGTFQYSVYTYGYVALPSSGSITVSGYATSVSVIFSPLRTFSILFKESGLIAGTSWSVFLNRTPAFYLQNFTSTTSTITVSEPNGTNFFIVWNVTDYDVSPHYGGFTINGKNVTVNVTFSVQLPLTLSITPFSKSISINQTISFFNNTSGGNPPYTYHWAVTLNSSTTSAYTRSGNVFIFSSIGIYRVYLNVTDSLGDSASSYSLITVNSPAVRTYQVIFTESGLLRGTSWEVTLNGSSLSSYSQTILFDEPNGSYLFNVSSIPEFSLSPSSGLVVVSGSNVTYILSFSRIYSVTFEETGLPLSDSWSVTLGNHSFSSTDWTISFSMKNGSYPYSVSSLGLLPTPASGTVILNGSPVKEVISFSPANGYFVGSIMPENVSISAIVNGSWTTYKENNGSFNISLKPGVHEIKMMAPGYETYVANITIFSLKSTVTPMHSLTKNPKTSTLDFWFIILLAVSFLAIIVVAVTITMWRNRKKKLYGG